jgi:polysaccharide biosynthesis/export protein
MQFSKFRRNKLVRIISIILLFLFPSNLVLAEIPFRILPNDVLRVEVVADTNISGIYPVTPDGTIPLPLIQEVKISGLTLAEACDLLNDRYSTYINNPKVNLVIEKYTGHVVTVTGAVTLSGIYEFPSNITVMDAISLAGGYTQQADISKVQLVRKSGNRMYKLNLDDYLSGHNLSANMTIESLDVVNVPYSLTSKYTLAIQIITPIISVLGLTISLMNAYNIAKNN